MRRPSTIESFYFNFLSNRQRVHFSTSAGGAFESSSGNRSASRSARGRFSFRRPRARRVSRPLYRRRKTSEAVRWRNPFGERGLA